RACGFAPIHDATPVRTASVLLGKALANGVVGVAILLAVGVGGVLAQLSQGRAPLSFAPYLLVWGLLLLPTFLLWSAYMLAAWAVARGRFGAYGLGLGVLVLTGYLALTHKMTWVTNWPLWGAVRWTDLGAFQLDRPALVLNRMAALSLAAFFLAVAVRFDPRRATDAVLTLGRLHPAGLWRTGRRLLPLAAVPLVLLIALGMQVDRGHQGDAAKKRAKEYWQKNLATWKDAPQPALADVELDVDLDPEGHAFTTRGTYTLVNRHAAALERYALTGGDHWEDVRWTVDGKDYTPEDRSRLYVFTPEQPLAPGATVRVGFQYHGRYPRGVSKNGGMQNEFILPAGVVLTSEGPSFAPVIGYQESIGIDEKENKYEPRVYVGRWYEGTTEAAWGTGTPYTTTLRLSGPADYTLNGVGTRVSDEVKDGRRVSVWKSDFPVNMFNIVAGRWAEVGGEGTRLFHHPAHGYNLEEMRQGLDAARRYYSEWFYPYPWKELKLSEFPGLALYAQGFPTNITFSEDIGFQTKSDPRANTAFLVTAHEAAHQWWGNLLVPGKGPGGNLLSEGTSHYSMLKLMEQVKGERVRMETAKRLEERYGKNRRVDGERPLVKIDDSREGDTTVTYDKGGWVVWMLEELMGREACHAGLQAFIRKYQGNADHPVLEDFVEHMRAFAPDPAAYDAFVKQWFFEVNVPEYRLSDAKVVKDGARWVTTVTVENVGTGRMPVEVAAVRGERFLPQTDEEAAKAPARPSPDYHDARAKTVLGPKEKARLTVGSDFEPEQLVVDPDVRVLQLRREQAVLKL
ncbi:MAG: M1 family aminopeptidase, partial [Archangium sp.]